MKRTKLIYAFSILVVISAAFLLWVYFNNSASNGFDLNKNMSAAINQSNPALKTVPTEAEPVLKIRNSPKFGPYLVSTRQLTLYYSTRDRSGESNCKGACTANWLPYIVPLLDIVLKGAGGINGKIGTIVKPNGSLQLTYNGSPLYFWHNDSEADEAFGQGIDGVWFVKKP